MVAIEKLKISNKEQYDMIQELQKVIQSQDEELAELGSKVRRSVEHLNDTPPRNEKNFIIRNKNQAYSRRSNEKRSGEINELLQKHKELEEIRKSEENPKSKILQRINQQRGIDKESERIPIGSKRNSSYNILRQGTPGLSKVSSKIDTGIRRQDSKQKINALRYGKLEAIKFKLKLDFKNLKLLLEH